MDQSESNAQSCGAMLKSAREAQGLDIANVADKLHLSKQLITEIEQDNYEHVATLAYGKGYVRGYANLLKLPLEEVMTAFDQLEWLGREGIDPETLAKSQPVLSKAKMQTPISTDLRNKARNNIGKILSAIVVLIIIILLLMYWQRDHKTNAPAKNNTVTTTITPSAATNPQVARDETINPSYRQYKVKPAQKKQNG